MRRLILAGFAALLVLGSASRLHAQTADDLFNEAALQTLDIRVHSHDWDTLRANFTLNDYYPADVTWNGVRVRNVGIRSRGLGSRSGVKPGLELNFAHYSSRAQFLGLKSLVLDNLTTDPSMIRERVAMGFLRRFGVPAPREAHAQVFVNGQSLGLYAIVEPIDTAFVQRTLGDAGGTLYEFHWIQPYFATFPGDNLDLYRPLFEARPEQGRSTFDLYDPIKELFRVINTAPAETFRDAVNARLDLEATLRLVAAQTFLAEWDGILGYAGMNNFYLHLTSGTKQGRFLPWDADHTFHAADYPVLAGALENVLMRRILEDPVLRARYVELIIEAIGAGSGDDWLVREITTEYLQIRDAALADPLKPYTNEEFEAAFAELLAFAGTRAAFVTGQLPQLQ